MLPLRNFRFILHARNSHPPQQERLDPPKERKGFTLHLQNSHRATERATRPAALMQFEQPLSQKQRCARQKHHGSSIKAAHFLRKTNK